MLNKGLAQYQQVNTHCGVEGASPHRLIQMLMEGVLQRLAEAKGAMQRNVIADKGEAIGKAITILSGLDDSLNKDIGGEMAANLDDLYGYMQRRLLEANLHNDEGIIDEVVGLMKTIKSGWDTIAPEVA
ncbi:flagellar protein FliS [marine gamma proteobacterium HTCC2143]|jgi:flagellar protein FliS|uniref:Flagellar secretion chaperone FliS n=1 Tax=marine gamma proteobacterium HTCC2143 TaxID=247633 RepID=A0YG70_9GAMM|nr:flagellar protein FliS [marine gamma proteobacterium HTCC2143]